MKDEIFYLGIFDYQNPRYLVVRFDSEKAADEALLHLQRSILYDEKGKPSEASWSRYSPDPLIPVMDEEEKKRHKDYKNAPSITWQNVLLGND